MTPLAGTTAISDSIAAKVDALADAGNIAGLHGADDLAADFESLFMSLVLKEMRQTVDGGGLFGGEASDTYGGLFDLYMGQHLASAGGLGIGKIINQYLDTANQS